MARRRSKKKSRKKLTKLAVTKGSLIRKGRKWSINSDLFHSRDCPAVARIASANVRSGTAPDSLKPHDCIVPPKAADPSTDREVSSTTVPPATVAASPPAIAATATAVGALPVTTPVTTVAHASAATARPAKQSGDNSSGCAEPINPYCSCNPCKCTPPCTCGLRKTETQSQTQWDANEQLLRHIKTAIYRPDPAKILKTHAKHDDHGDTGVSGRYPVRMSVVALEQALSQSGNAQIRKQMATRHSVGTAGAGDEGHDGSHGHAASVRKSEHRGHQIELKTHYEISINGEPLNIHIGVLNDGKVHCHSIPNYSTASGIDLVKAIIDAFPDDYPSRN